MFGFVVLAALALSANAVILDGKCPDLKPVENFDVKQYSGIWYEILKYPYSAEHKGKCAQAEYTPEGDIVKVKNTHVVDGVQTFVEGTAKFAEDANKAAKLLVTFKFGNVSRESPLSVLETDYKNYAIAYVCRFDEKANNHHAAAWILSRTKKLEGDAKTAVDNYLKANAQELDSSKFLETDFSEEACKFTTTSLIAEAPKKN